MEFQNHVSINKKWNFDIKKSFSCDNLFVVGKHTCCEMDGSGGVDAALCVRAQHCEPVGRVLHLREALNSKEKNVWKSHQGIDVDFVFNQVKD